MFIFLTLIFSIFLFFIFQDEDDGFSKAPTILITNPSPEENCFTGEEAEAAPQPSGQSLEEPTMKVS